jgi:hypothetical protein
MRVVGMKQFNMKIKSLLLMVMGITILSLHAMEQDAPQETDRVTHEEKNALNYWIKKHHPRWHDAMFIKYEQNGDTWRGLWIGYANKLRYSYWSSPKDKPWIREDDLLDALQCQDNNTFAKFEFEGSVKDSLVNFLQEKFKDKQTIFIYKKVDESTWQVFKKHKNGDRCEFTVGILDKDFAVIKEETTCLTNDQEKTAFIEKMINYSSPDEEFMQIQKEEKEKFEKNKKDGVTNFDPDLILTSYLIAKSNDMVHEIKKERARPVYQSSIGMKFLAACGATFLIAIAGYSVYKIAQLIKKRTENYKKQPKNK